MDLPSERLEKIVGRAQAEDFLAWNNQVHPITIHTNALENRSRSADGKSDR